MPQLRRLSPLQEVEDFFKEWVLPKLDAVEDKKHASFSIVFSIEEFWKEWAPRRYQLHAEKMGDPTLPELRTAMKNIKVSYKDTRLHLLGEWRAEEGLRITLKASTTDGGKNNLGSCLFRNRRDAKKHSMSWLYIDMMHLIMLMAERCQVDVRKIKEWHMDAKAFLTDFGKNM